MRKKPRRKGEGLTGFFSVGTVVLNWMQGFMLNFLLSPRRLILRAAGLKERRKPPGEASFARFRSVWRRRVLKKSRRSVKTIPARANRKFEFNKRSQLFIRVHNETLSVVTMRVCNPDRSRAGIQS